MIAHPGDLLDDRAEQQIAVVRIRRVRPRRELQRLTIHVARDVELAGDDMSERLTDLPHAVGRIERRRIFGISAVVVAALVVEQLLHRDRVAARVSRMRESEQRIDLRSRIVGEHRDRAARVAHRRGGVGRRERVEHRDERQRVAVDRRHDGGRAGLVARHRVADDGLLVPVGFDGEGRRLQLAAGVEALDRRGAEYLAAAREQEAVGWLRHAIGRLRPGVPARSLHCAVLGDGDLRGAHAVGLHEDLHCLIDRLEGGERRPGDGPLAGVGNVLLGEDCAIDRRGGRAAALHDDRIVALGDLLVEEGLVVGAGEAVARDPGSDEIVLEHRAIGRVARQRDIGRPIGVQIDAR